MVKEFKEFTMKGNLIDLAVGVIVGGAFGKAVSPYLHRNRKKYCFWKR